jgi:hypothetical protein
MADITTELASKCGISPEMAKKGLGVLLAAMKHALPADAFAKVEGAIPGGGQLLADAQAEGAQASGGILGTLKDMAGKLFGGGGAAALVAHLGKLGFSPEQVKSFLPHVLEFLKSKLPPNVMQHITALLPHEAAAAP